MDKYSTHPSYIPPAIAGYVHATNYGRCDNGDSRKEHTLEFCRYSTAAWLDVPVDDVIAVAFAPSGNTDSPFSTAFATHVREKHAGVIREHKDYLRLMLQVLDGIDPL